MQFTVDCGFNASEAIAESKAYSNIRYELINYHHYRTILICNSVTTAFNDHSTDYLQLVSTIRLQWYVLPNLLGVLTYRSMG